MTTSPLHSYPPPQSTSTSAEGRGGPSSPARPTRIVVVGGGFVGFTLARRLERRLRPGEAEVVLVDAAPSMTYQPFLAEAAAGTVEPRHLAVPLRASLRRARVVTARVTQVDRAARGLLLELPDGVVDRMTYDELVLAPGSVTRTQPVPGLEEHAVGFTSLAEARGLRDAVLTRVGLAADTPDPDRRRAALTVVVAGGGYSGVEAVAELHGLAVAA
ncbi:MAG: NAD(P)/FAD-dependent oxidoreductase, partial [Phycicoccus sp.]